MVHAEVRWGGLVAAVLLGSSVTVAADDLSPMQLLDRMSDAVRQRDYEGHFVVQAGDHLDALYLVHRVDGGAEKERLVSLTGKEREVIRSEEAVACLAPERDQHINVRRRAGDSSFSPLRAVNASQLSEFYRMALLEPERVAGRDTLQVLIEPKDDLRFGYRLFIDSVTSLPLRTVMFDERGNTLSQMMFVELKTEGSITPIERDISAMQRARAGEERAIPDERLAQPGWSFSSLPPGYQLHVHRWRGVAEGVREHFIFSDGLANVSVYVQPARGDALKGVKKLGAARAVGRLVANHEVIVVGEVPVKTLQWFTQHIQATAP
ncbi:MAG: MucB/RseB C-terminal domain-containing protein [Gammaproteobacteria bacterium]|nr:MucB/RseB C-terminal domain-containing protein [Gammaproteobacteria bacterium]MCB1925613.1 MucB/RseB C-terminal domain-containing protein [Gammaproteobacteria bacterium]